LKARPLLRIRYGSEADVSLVAEGADIWLRSRVFCQRIPPALKRFAPRLMIAGQFAACGNVSARI